MVIHYYRALLNMWEGRGEVHCMASRGRGRGPLPPILSPSVGAKWKLSAAAAAGRRREEGGGGGAAERKGNSGGETSTLTLLRRRRRRPYRRRPLRPSMERERERRRGEEATQCKIAHYGGRIGGRGTISSGCPITYAASSLMFRLSSGIWKEGGSAIDACEEDKLTLRSQPPPICQTTPPYLLANEQLFGKFYSSFCPVAHYLSSSLFSSILLSFWSLPLPNGRFLFSIWLSPLSLASVSRLIDQSSQSVLILYFPGRWKSSRNWREGGREEREAGQLSYLFIMHSESRTDGRRTVVVGWMSMEWRTRTD